MNRGAQGHALECGQLTGGHNVKLILPPSESIGFPELHEGVHEHIPIPCKNVDCLNLMQVSIDETLEVLEPCSILLYSQYIENGNNLNVFQLINVY